MDAERYQTLNLIENRQATRLKYAGTTTAIIP
jgi:hypothetical protein